MDKPSTCTYCTLAEARIFDETTLSIAFKDVFPVSPGHTLIIPRRHVESYFDLTNQEREDMLILMNRVKDKLKEELNPNGFNIGINLGRVAGAGIAGHLHIHIVPRWFGDTNFMPVIANSGVVPQALLELGNQLRAALAR